MTQRPRWPKRQRGPFSLNLPSYQPSTLKWLSTPFHALPLTGRKSSVQVRSAPCPNYQHDHSRSENSLLGHPYVATSGEESTQNYYQLLSMNSFTTLCRVFERNHLYS